MQLWVRTGLVAIVVLAGACAKGTDANVAGDVGGEVDTDAGPGGPRDGSVLPQVDSAVPDDAAPADSAIDASDPCADALAKITFDFETGIEGFTHGISDGVTPNGWPFDPWSQGTASIGTPCKTGKCLGAELTQNYAQCHRGYVMSPPIDLSACTGRTVALAFQHAYAFWTGSYGGQTWFDGGVVEVSGDGSTWALPTGTFAGTVKINPDRGLSYACVQPNGFGVDGKQGFVGKQAATVRAELTLPANAVTKTMQVRFSTAAGVSSSTTSADGSRSATDFGWRVDDIGFVVK